MSRLDSVIRRLTAQRDVLNRIAADIASLPGPVIELGLGNGRTYDHLRERFPGRRIIAFDRALNCNAASRPPPDDLILGEIAETARAFRGLGAALVHADIGSGLPGTDAVTVTWLPGIAADLLGLGGIAASELPLDHPGLAALPLPPGIAPDRYFLYRRV